MQVLKISAVLLCFLAYYAHCQPNMFGMQHALSAANSGSKVGVPPFHLQGAGGSSGNGNWNVGGNAGVGAKVWESQNGRHSVGAGVNVGQAFGKTQGQSWNTRPNVGAGAGYVFRFRR